MIPVALGILLSIQLGPETPLGMRLMGAADSQDSSPAAAWNGHAGLLVWEQNRRSASPLLRVSPLHADGSLVNPAGTPLVPATTARIASNGSSTFLLVYTNADGLLSAVPLDENGQIAGATASLGTVVPTTDDYQLVSNG